MLRYLPKPAVTVLALTLSGCVSGIEPTWVTTADGRDVRGVVSWREMRDANVVKQGFDFSCGAASLATLMRYYFDDKVSEADVLENILTQLSEEQLEDRRKAGLSLLDLQQTAERMGYQAAGVRLDLNALAELRGPILVHIERDDYKHFAILRGVQGDRVFLADPSRGNLRQSVSSFADDWSGYALILGKQGFGLPDDHQLAVRETEGFRPELQASRSALFRR